MTIPVLIILGALWAAVLVPPLLRARSERKTGAIGDYAHTLGALKTSNRTLTGLSRSTAGLVDGSMHARRLSKSEAIRKRRKDVLLGMLVSSVVTFLLAILLSNSMLWIVHFLCDIALGAYVYLLIQLKEQQRSRREQNTRSLNDF